MKLIVNIIIHKIYAMTITKLYLKYEFNKVFLFEIVLF